MINIVVRCGSPLGVAEMLPSLGHGSLTLILSYGRNAYLVNAVYAQAWFC